MVPEKPAEEENDANQDIDVSHPPRKRAGDGNGSSAKKTRDMPNLSECHNCGYRINTSNSKDRLQTLNSEWRVVLLCIRCFNRVESAELCSYCFTETSSDDECYRCRKCARRVHRYCVSNYQGTAPWSYSYSGSGSDFTFCVDCWVPKSYAKLRSVAISKQISSRKRKISKSDEIPSKSLEDVVKEANCGVETKAAVAARAREKAVMKAVVARQAMELANSALDLVAKRDDNNTAVPVDVDDAELAFRLHRAMNSSPRISKNSCSVNLACLDLPTTEDSGTTLLVTTSRLGEHQENGKSDEMVARLKQDEADCSIMDNPRGKQEDLHLNGSGSHCQFKCDMKADRYSLKYYKRKSRNMKATPDCKPMLQYFKRKSNLKAVRNCKPMLQYCKRKSSLKAIPDCKPMLLQEHFLLESQPSAPGVLVNCFKESKTVTNAPSQACAVPMQASAHASGTSQSQC